MLRSPSSKDMCGLHILHLKVNILLYTCVLGSLKDGILLDPPPLCILRFESYTCVEEEVKRKGMSTPSTREAWKRRRRRGEEAQKILPLTTPDARRLGPPGARAILCAASDYPGCLVSWTAGCPVPCLGAALAKWPCIFPFCPHLPLHFLWAIYTPSPPSF